MQLTTTAKKHSPPMRLKARLDAMDDRQMARLVKRLGLLLIVGVVLFVAFYVSDQYRPAGPSLAERTVAAAEEAVRTAPNSLTARMDLAKVYGSQGRYADAIKQYDEILGAKADAVGAILARGQTYRAAGQLDAARTDFLAVIDQLKDDEMAGTDLTLQAAYYGLGAVDLDRGEAKLAVDELTNALRISRTDADTLYLLGVALDAAGDPATAVESLRSAVLFVPTGWCEPYTEMAKAFGSLQDAEGAAYAQGMVASCQGHLDEAKQQLAAITAGAHLVEAQLGLALILEQQGDLTAAAASYRTVLEAQPANVVAISALNRIGSPSASAGEGN